MSPRALTIALLASAALNVFLVGAGAGVVAGRALAPAAAPPANPLRAAAQRLAPANREALLQLMQDQVQANGPVLLDARQARREAKRLMQVQPFDAAAAQAALARARADDLQVRGRLESAVIQFSAALPPDQRAILSAGLMRPPPRPAHAGLLARLGRIVRPAR